MFTLQHVYGNEVPIYFILVEVEVVGVKCKVGVDYSTKAVI